MVQADLYVQRWIQIHNQQANRMIPLVMILFAVTCPYSSNKPFGIMSFTSAPPEEYFRFSFMKQTQSKYTQKYSFRSGQTQEDIPAWELDDVEEMYRVRDLVASTHGVHIRIFKQNPLHLGFYLYSIEEGILCVLDIEH